VAIVNARPERQNTWLRRWISAPKFLRNLMPSIDSTETTEFHGMSKFKTTYNTV
jgi:hypothetical protein